MTATLHRMCPLEEADDSSGENSPMVSPESPESATPFDDDTIDTEMDTDMEGAYYSSWSNKSNALYFLYSRSHPTSQWYMHSGWITCPNGSDGRTKCYQEVP